MTAIRAEQLTKRYGDTLALDALDLAVEEAEVYGYLGPNGAGKTTTIRLLLGLHRPTAGRAELLGVDAWRGPVDAHRRVAYVRRRAVPVAGADERRRRSQFLARLHGGTDEAYRDVLVGGSSWNRTRRCARSRRATARRCNSSRPSPAAPTS